MKIQQKEAEALWTTAACSLQILPETAGLVLQQLVFLPTADHLYKIICNCAKNNCIVYCIVVIYSRNRAKQKLKNTKLMYVVSCSCWWWCHKPVWFNNSKTHSWQVCDSKQCHKLLTFTPITLTTSLCQNLINQKWTIQSITSLNSESLSSWLYHMQVKLFVLMASISHENIWTLTVKIFSTSQQARGPGSKHWMLPLQMSGFDHILWWMVGCTPAQMESSWTKMFLYKLHRLLWLIYNHFQFRTK